MLHDREQTSFTLVTIPEAMSVLETQRYLALLTEQGVPVTDLIVNRVEQEHGACEYCRARVQTQRPWLKKIATAFKGLEIHYVPLMAKEVRGFKDLKKVWSDQIEPPMTRKNPHLRSVSSVAKSSFDLQSRKIVIFGGKGGVGKTTAAAAYALALATANPEEKLLVFSTDPAHSLSDSFGEEIGESKRAVAGFRIWTEWRSIPGSGLRN
jgi:arsenite-transporting ATPase